jgi:hypothetical protein
MDALRQGTRHINEYIADFQRLHAQIGATFGADDAMHAFERGLEPGISEKLRVAGVDALSAAIAMAARVGSLTARTAAPGTQRSGAGHVAVHQMDVDDDSAASPSLDERIAKAVLCALQSQQDRTAAPGSAPQAHRGFPLTHSGRGGRVGRGGRGAGNGSVRPLPDIPGMPADVVRHRWDARQCLRCGDDNHRAMACPNALSSLSKN